MNLRSYDSEYESIPLRARAPVTSPMKIINVGTSPVIKKVYHEQQHYDDLYNQNQCYLTSIVDIHSKQQQQRRDISASNYSLSSVFNSDHRDSSLTCLNNNIGNNYENTSRNSAANMPRTSPIYHVNNYENNNSSKATTPIASITPSGLSGYPTPLQTLYAQKFNNNKYFHSNQSR